jgi:hypothetical protein
MGAAAPQHLPAGTERRPPHSDGHRRCPRNVAAQRRPVFRRFRAMQPVRRYQDADKCHLHRVLSGKQEAVPRGPRGPAGAIAPATSTRCPHASRGPKPPASARPAPGGRFPPAGSGAGLSWCGLHGSWWQCSARAGETHAFPFPARRGRGRSESEPPAPLPWQGPSPLPQRPADPWPAGGPKPPASARPAPGKRFSPAGSGAGLRCSCTCRSTGHCPARAGKRSAFPVPARTDESTFTAPMAGAIAPATAPR